MSIYTGYVNGILKELNHIKDAKDAIDFLFQEKSRFIRIGNTGEDANELIKWIDNEIERRKLEILFKPFDDNPEDIKLGSKKKPGRPKALVKHFSEYLQCTDKKKFAEILKEDFSNESVKGIALMILALAKMSPPRIAYTTRTGLYKAIEQYFNKDIGSDAAKNIIISNPNIYSNDLLVIQRRIGNLLNKNFLQ